MKFNKWTIVILMLLHHNATAEISIDDSLGSARPLNSIDGQFSIGQELGSLKGGNLFHSFQEFNVEAGESAVFTGDNAIQNVISRVTGGNESVINGILRSQVGSADFYFINPAGLTFSENAQVDVPAAFHVSTAGELIFADGSSFSALNPEASTLTVVEPEGFGFILEQNGNLQIVGGQLAFKPGTDVSLSANSLSITDVELDNGNIQQAEITAEQTNSNLEQGVRLNLTAVDSSTTQMIPVTDLTATATGGDLLIENSIINVSGNGSGRLVVRAGTLEGNNSQLSADNLGAIPMQAEDGANIHVNSMLLNQTSLTNNALDKGGASSITIEVNNAMQLFNGATITADTFSESNAGNVTVAAKQLTIDSQGAEIITGISSSAMKDSQGDAGTVSVTISELMQLLNGGGIVAFTFGEGNAGDVIVSAEQLTIDGQDTITSNGVMGSSGALPSNLQLTFAAVGSTVTSVLNNRLSDFTGIFSNTFPGSHGNAGSIKVIINEDLQLLNGGLITSVTFGKGDAGSIAVAAKQLTIDAENNAPFITGITNSAMPGSHGNAGSIAIAVSEAMQLLNGGLISANTFSEGNADDVTVSAGQLIIDSQDSELLTGILNSALPSSHGNAGAVSITVYDDMQMLNGGIISADTFSEGNAGNVTMSAQQFTIDGQDSAFLTGISSNVMPGGRGDAGNISIKVNEAMQLLNGGTVSSFTFGEGDAGRVTVEAEQLTVDARHSFNFNDSDTEQTTLADKRQLITNAILPVLQRILSNDLSGFTGIFSNAFPGSSGDGGLIEVKVNGEIQLLNGGEINTITFGEGNAGSITIATEQLTVDGQNNSPLTGISNSTLLGSKGDAGPISIMVNKELKLLNGAVIDSVTLSQGNAGNITVEAEELTIDTQDSRFFTGIINSSEQGSIGNAGEISIATNETLQLLNGGVISSDSLSQGNAGSIDVKTRQLTIDSENGGSETGIFSTSGFTATGRAGDIAITALDQVALKREGIISIASLSTTAHSFSSLEPDTTEPQITINTPKLSLAQSSIITATANGEINAAPIEINVSDNLNVLNSQITTSAFNGDGGSIAVDAGNWVGLNGSQLTTSVLGQENGDGGNITMNAPVLVMNNGFIQANTAAEHASGGDISLSVEQLISSGNRLLVGGSEPLRFIMGQPNFNVIQAASPSGVSGRINITSPELNIVGILANVATPDLDIERIGQDPCGSSQENNLRNLGHGGAPAFQHGENHLLINRHDERKLNNKGDQQSGTSINQTERNNISVDCMRMQRKPLS